MSAIYPYKNKIHFYRRPLSSSYIDKQYTTIIGTIELDHGFQLDTARAF